MKKNTIISVLGAVAFVAVSALILSFAVSVIYYSHFAELRKEDERRRNEEEIRQLKQMDKELDRESRQRQKELIEGISKVQKLIDEENARLLEDRNKQKKKGGL